MRRLSTDRLHFSILHDFLLILKFWHHLVGTRGMSMAATSLRSFLSETCSQDISEALIHCSHIISANYIHYSTPVSTCVSTDVQYVSTDAIVVANAISYATSLSIVSTPVRKRKKVIFNDGEEDVSHNVNLYKPCDTQAKKQEDTSEDVELAKKFQAECDAEMEELERLETFSVDDDTLHIEMRNEHITWLINSGAYLEKQIANWTLDKLSDEVENRLKAMNDERPSEVDEKVKEIKSRPNPEKKKYPKTLTS
ncbi:hypothetical protein L1987_34121 [Smallanthus sonchifolius]|uniref:Uncharacterized protein n=1 Tax=Smallanthus sonchifolius TaxID=185202 RepID=A0ACB9HSR3_9ASTR|nr:hypothetical protein L1987_34121 [Smallanthus sonchifolius]